MQPSPHPVPTALRGWPGAYSSAECLNYLEHCGYGHHA